MNRITIDRDILGGKPIIRGTRISVEFVLGLLGSGMSVDEVLDEYPHLTKEDVQACLMYASQSLKNDIILELGNKES